MRAVVVGAGAVGGRCARQLLGGPIDDLAIFDIRREQAEAVARSIGEPATAATSVGEAMRGAALVVCCQPGAHAATAAQALAVGADVVSVAGDIDAVAALLALDGEARRAGRHVVVGAGFAPGLDGVLARHAAAGLDVVTEVHVARSGSGGPACSADLVRSARHRGREWYDGAWRDRRGRGGRVLCWFPEPVGARDCVVTGSASAVLAVPAFPGVERVSCRTAPPGLSGRLAALSPFSRRTEDPIGAVWVEVRGRRGSTSDSIVMGAVDRPALAAATVAAVAGLWANQGRLARAGAAGLAELVEDTVPFLRELSDRGVRAAVFEPSGVRGHGPTVPAPSEGAAAVQGVDPA